MVAFLLQTHLFQRAIKIKDQARTGQWHAQFVSGIQHQTQILLLERNCKAWSPIPFHNLRPTVGKHPTARRPLADCFVGLLQVNATRLRLAMDSPRRCDSIKGIVGRCRLRRKTRRDTAARRPPCARALIALRARRSRRVVRRRQAPI